MPLQVDLREELVRQISRIPSDWVGVLMSGGADSSTLACAAIEAKKQLTAYTFTLTGVMSSDFSLARRNCHRSGIPFVPILLPVNLDILYKDVKHLVYDMGLRRKTKIECTWPFLHIFDQIKDDHLLMGLGADGLFGMGQKAAFARVRASVEDFDRYRASTYEAEDYAAIPHITEIAGRHGKTIYTPFRTTKVFNLFKGVSYQQINSPRQKWLLRTMFPMMKALQVGLHQSFQIGDSLIDQHFEKLLGTEHNTSGAKSMVAFYNNMAREASFSRRVAEYDRRTKKYRHDKMILARKGIEI